jgi:hypothetical protein
LQSKGTAPYASHEPFHWLKEALLNSRPERFSATTAQQSKHQSVAVLIFFSQSLLYFANLQGCCVHEK